MRVLSVSNFFDTHGGGLERVAGHLAREFAWAGHKSAWAASDADGAPESIAEIVPLRCINPTESTTGLPMPIPGPRSIKALNSATRKSDLIVVHDALYITSIAAMVLAKLHRRPVIVIQHIGEIPFANPLMRGIMWLANTLVTRPMLAIADKVFFISKSVQEKLCRRSDASLVFYGVDHRTFHPNGRVNAGELRAKWSLPPDHPLAIFVGRFVEKKGVRILEEIARRRPSIHFALVGRGPLQPHEWGLSNVHVLGQQPQEALADLYRAADFLLLPSVGEGYPLVIQEAMACGLPVICGDESARADPNASQWLFGVDVNLADVDASANRIEVAIDSIRGKPIDRRAMSAYAAEAYNWPTMAHTILASAPVKGDQTEKSKAESSRHD